jgi:hypothetical protein
MPAPQVIEADGSQAPPGNAVSNDGVVNRVDICAGVSPGSRETINATTPATCGVAMLVPL